MRSVERSYPQPVELAACAVLASKIVKAREVYIVNNGDIEEQVIGVKENLTS